jgi:hypothetical protein
MAGPAARNAAQRYQPGAHAFEYVLARIKLVETEVGPEQVDQR